MLAACSQMPVAGPTVSELVDQDSAAANTYVVVELTPSIVRKLQALAPHTLSNAFSGVAPAAQQHIGIGDTVSVTVFEAGSGGLFSPAAADNSTAGASVSTLSNGVRQLTLPNQLVDLQGNITVPYAGQIAVAGRSPAEAQALVERHLEHQALLPQALVTVVQNQSNVVTVSGDVAAPGRLPLYLQGTRVLDVIAQAGGSKWAAYDTAVQLTRNGASQRIPMEELLDNPAENVFLQAGDMVHLIRQPRSVAVLGATTTNALVPFDTERLTLAETLAKSGGLNDNQANPRGVFVFRFEPATVVRELMPQTANVALPDVTAVVFRTDLREGQGLFLSESFAMNDKDVVFVSDTQSVQLVKLMNLLRNTAMIFQSRGAFVTN